MARGAPLVSVVVTSYSLARLGDVEELLASLGSQTHRRLETVFVAERTLELASAVEAIGRDGAGPLRVLFNDGPPGLAAARNLGVRHCRGEVVAFIDDDALAFPDWAEQIVAGFEADADAIGLTGPALPRWQAQPMSWLPPEFYWIISCTGWFDADTVKPVRNAWGMNMAFRREAFERCQFDERLGGNMGAVDGNKLGLLGEDTLFSLRLRLETGKLIVYNPRVRVLHKVYGYRFTPQFIRRRAFWEGYTKAWLRKLAEREPQLAEADLTTEYQLLGRIAFGFFPRALTRFPRQPARSWRELRLAVQALSHLALGYAAGSLEPLGKAVGPLYGR